MGFAAHFLDEASTALRKGHTFSAERLTDAADACRRPVEHLAHLGRRPGPPAPPKGAIGGHLRRVYFRLRLCDYFLEQIPAPKPRRLLELGQRFYQQALQADQFWLRKTNLRPGCP